MSTNATAIRIPIRVIVWLPYRTMDVTKSPNAATNARLAANGTVDGLVPSAILL